MGDMPWSYTPPNSPTVCRPLGSDVEETFALAAHLVSDALDLVEQVVPGHAAAQRLRDGIDTLGVTPGCRCHDCGQIPPAEDFTLIPTSAGERQQLCAACCTARARARLGPDVEGLR